MKLITMKYFRLGRLLPSGVLSGLVLGILLFSGNCTEAKQTPRADKEKANKQDVDDSIQVIDRDGRKLKATLVPALPPQVERPANPAGLRGMINGRVKVKDKDGNELEIVPQSIMVSQSVRRTIVDGEEKLEQVQNTIVTDADGNQYQIETPPMAGTVQGLDVGDAPPRAMAMVMPPNASKYYLGVATESVPSALAERKNLDSGTGLVILQVMADSPAERAGLKANDVLLYAEDKPVARAEDLVDVVQNTGEEGKELVLIVVRDDEEMTISVTPQLRPQNPGISFLPEGIFMLEQLGFEGELPPGIRERLQENPGFQFRFERALPGMILGDEMMSEVEALERLEEHFKKMEQHFEGFEERFEQLERFRGVLEQNRKQLLRRGEDADGEARSKPNAQRLLLEMQRQGKQPPIKPNTNQQIELLQQQIESLTRELESLKQQQKKDN